MTAPVVLVTGAASGIGAAIASNFAGAGARLVLADVDAARLADVEAALRRTGCDVLAAATDVRDRTSVEALVEAAVARFGVVDVACLNAGVGLPEVPLTQTTDEVIDQLIDVNLRGAILCARAVIPALRDGGSLIFTSSTSGLLAHPNAAVYAATKIALIGLARSLVPELSPRRIRVNCVCPGGVDTPLVRRLANQAQIAEAMDANPLGRIAEPDDVAHAVAFLASPAAWHVNGVALRVDGGEAVIGAGP